MTRVQELRSMRSLLSVRQVAKHYWQFASPTVRRYAALREAGLRPALANRLRFRPVRGRGPFLEGRSSE
jgi:hypothetical protein